MACSLPTFRRTGEINNGRHSTGVCQRNGQVEQKQAEKRWLDDAAGEGFCRIRLKSCALTFSGTEFVCRKTCVKNRWLVGVSHASMSCWNFLCGAASPQTPASRGRHQQQQRCWFGNGRIRTGARTAAGGSAEVGAPGRNHRSQCHRTLMLRKISTKSLFTKNNM